ncbi:hypothetical protein Cfor_01216, partial [Coptotermes formosanus]
MKLSEAATGQQHSRRLMAAMTTCWSTVWAELLDALRRRRGRGDCTSDDDEDLGLPHSPCNSPTTADVLLEQGLK